MKRGRSPETRRVVILGAGFAGLNAAKGLGDAPDFEVLVIDRENHHLFQPLLYQVATAGLSPADIAEPTRAILAKFQNIRVVRARASGIDLDGRSVRTTCGEFPYDVLIVACGSRHSYFGHEEWERFAPGLKSLEDATTIRRRILDAFEAAECADDEKRRRELQTFVVVGAGPTGVELAGAIGEMSRFTLARDFRDIDPTDTRVVLVEAASRVLPSFPEELSARAARDLESLGVRIRTSAPVTGVDESGVTVDGERIAAATVLWAAGVRSSPLGAELASRLDDAGRVPVEPDLTLPGHPEVFVAGDLARCEGADGNPLPQLAAVALQQGRWIARNLRRQEFGKERRAFRYRDKGQMTTIGRSRAVVDTRRFRLHGFVAWVVWLVVHIYYLVGLRNRLFVAAQWAWSYLTYGRGARLIVGPGNGPGRTDDET